MPIRDFHGKCVLVTGAASGIGYECARSFAARGADIVMTDINAERLAAAQADIERLGVRCLALVCDVADDSSVAAFADRVLAQVGNIDVLINNAGVGFLGAFLHTPREAWRKSFDVNVMGVVNMTRAFLPAMRKDGAPRAIVNIASAAGFAPTPSMSAYAASKHAVVGLSEVLAMELGDSNVAVTIVAPGVVNTDIVQANAYVAPEVSGAQLHKLQAYYKAKGCAPRIIAEGIVRGVRAGKAVVAVGPFAQLSCALMRLSRKLTRKVTLASAKSIGFSFESAGE